MKISMNVVSAVAAAAIAGIASAQCGTGGSCFQTHGPFCNDVDCCNAVCAVDPFCCNTQWDTICVNEANSLCLGCGSPGSGSCYATGGPYCNEAACCNAVCAIDSFCCNVSWDSVCVSEANDLCGCGDAAAGSCFATGGPYCDDAYCCNTVCGVDPFCCNTAWDTFCVGEAYDYCTCGGTETGSCYGTHGPYCNDETCCNTVCNVDPFCCNNSWDSLCVNEALEMCPFCGDPLIHDCYSTGGPYCSDANCCNTVCAQDPFCCNVNWDTVCVNEAVSLCPGCGNPTNDCCVAHSTPYCADANCCNTVCAQDPFCCNTAWDSICANEAAAICGICGFPGDECTGALSIFTGNTNFSTNGATTSLPPLPAACDEGFGLSLVNDIWFVYQAPANGTLTVSLCNSSTGYDSRIAGYAGSCGNLVLLACNDDFCGVQSQMSFATTCGQLYHIRVGGFAGSGTGMVTLTQTGSCCPADLDGNGVVGASDLAILLGAWATSGADLNGDGTTNAADLALLLGAWGPC